MELIAKAFIKAQSEMSNPIKGNNNPFFKSKYADLNAIREVVIPVLNNHGIAVLQPLVNIDGKNYVKTLLIHESGQTIEGLTEIIYNKQNDAQSQGSGITYARRYGLQSLVCVGAEDDDGNKASKTPTTLSDENRDIERLKACSTLEELQKTFTAISKKTDLVVKIKEEMKVKLTPQKVA